MTRRATRLLAVAVAALLALPAAPAAAAEDAVTMSVELPCFWLPRGEPTPVRVVVMNAGDTDVAEATVRVTTPAGVAATVTPASAPLFAKTSFVAHVHLTPAADAPVGVVPVRIDLLDGDVVLRTEQRSLSVVDRPAAPAGVTATPGNGAAVVSWTPGPWHAIQDPAHDTRTYRVTADPGGATVTVRDTTTTRIAGLANGTAYTFTVTEWNEFGETASAPSAPVTPAGVPGVPPDVAVTGSGTSRTVSWGPADPNGAPVTGYVVTAYPGGTTTQAAADVTSAEVTGLAEDVEHAFTVHAVNAAGAGAQSPGPHGRPGAFGGTVTLTATHPQWFDVEVFDDDPAADGWLVRLEPAGTEVYAARGADGGAVVHAGPVLPGTWVTARVTPVNAAGAGPESGAFGPGVQPGPVQEPYFPAPVPTDGGFELCFVAFWVGGREVTAYVVGDQHGREWRIPASKRRLAVTGLPNGEPLALTMRVETDGVLHEPGDPTVHVVTPEGPPAAPQGVTATRGDGSIALAWDPHAGAASFDVTVEPGGVLVRPRRGATGVTVGGLANGTAYAVSVRARNAFGLSPAAEVTGVVPAGLPGAPGAVTATIDGPRRVVVSWTAAAANGSPVTSYTVTSSPPGLSATVGGTSATFADVPGGTPYTFAVAATNAAGTGASATSNAVTLDGTPPVVSTTTPAAFTTTRTAGLAWSSPDATSYDVRYRVARYDGWFGAYRHPAEWQAVAQTSVLVAARDGWTYCFSVRGTDDAGNTGAWTPDRCTAAPLDDRSLSASAAWARTTGAPYYAGTMTATTTAGAGLARTNVRARRLAVVATRCPSCGTVGVYLDGTLVRTVSTRSAVTAYRTVYDVDLGRRRAGTVTLKALSGRVYVDGLGATRV